MYVFAVLLLVFALYVAAGSNSDDSRTTTHAVTATADDTASIPDFDGDGSVGFGDFLIFAGAFGSSQNDEGYEARYDLNGDGEIGFLDFLIFAENFGKKAPSSTERDALVALYKATDGPNWMRNSNWLSAAPLGDWYGVRTDADGRVVELDLGNNNLQGTLPPEVGKLTGLRFLLLERNKLWGSLPQSLTNLTKLILLKIESTQLSSPSDIAFQIWLRSVGTEEISPDVITLPPPTWIFAGDVPAAHQTTLREEMEYVRGYFVDRYGVEATGFTVLVGADYEALSPVYRDILNSNLSNYYQPQGKYQKAWVTSSPAGSAVITLVFGTLQSNPVIELKKPIPHEYFHVLQGQLASGFAQLHNGEIAWYSDRSVRGPYWLVEGAASYAGYEYVLRTESTHYSNRYGYLRDLTWFLKMGRTSQGDLATMADYRAFNCTFSGNYSYPLGQAATAFLVEQSVKDSYVNYWKLLGERSTWQQAFEEAFGIGVDDFYEDFDEWLPSQLLPLVQLKLQMRWPDMENQSQVWRFLYPYIDWDTWPSGTRTVSTGSTGLTGLPLYLTVTYDEGSVGKGYLSLWWSDDQCTQHLLGWYKDGELTDRREDASAVEFTGRSSTIEWTIPGHPDTLPRLEEGKRTPGCR